MTNEVLSGIKVIKFYGWELSFRDIIGKIRSNEMDFLKRTSYLSISSAFLWLCAPLVITAVSFGSFIWIYESEMFTANVAFVSISLFNILRFPITVLPGIISAMIAVPSKFSFPFIYYVQLII
jgi:ATP-binding cassette subfamily C (CFTR/MRP) protein 1